MIATSELTCPKCGHRSMEAMPTDACIYFYDCAGCGAVLRSKAGMARFLALYGERRGAHTFVDVGEGYG